jgi:hypothetical protein
MCNPTAQGEESAPLDLRNNDLSFKETEITSSDLAAKRTVLERGSPRKELSVQVAAAPRKKALKTEEIVTKAIKQNEQLTADNGQENINSVDVPSNIDRGKKVAQVDYIVNKKWDSLIPDAR